ncbi:hypothetical protein CYMTET_27192 [Cymbomonas tetramitiformis]|uniref:C2H2-type domain-containing protein n=1 Tax=Cymbomonas tetramitiformis TaxID=36881 RepID=A0AAE0FQR5_9CHLO|nr:hypothetical protein CYMTET_27192 [Cymbomonas tetramitiformis]
MEVESSEVVRSQLPLVYIPHRRRLPLNDPLFEQGNLEREVFAKQVTQELTERDASLLLAHENTGEHWEACCPIAGCKAVLAGPAALELHYSACHSQECSVCGAVFPSSRLLDLHVSEPFMGVGLPHGLVMQRHDSFFAAMAARDQKVFECLVDGCAKKFANDADRHRHLVDQHKYPRSFNFHVGVRHRHLSQRKRRQQAAQTHREPDAAMDTELDELSKAMGGLRTGGGIPAEVSFGRRGRGGRGGGFARGRGRGKGSARGKGRMHMESEQISAQSTTEYTGD